MLRDCAVHLLNNGLFYCRVIHRLSKGWCLQSSQHTISLPLELSKPKNKSEEVEAELTKLNFNFDLIAFTETWFTSNADVSEFPGYKPISVFRDGKRGGGVSLYVQNYLCFEVLSDYSIVCTDFETVCIAFHRVAIMVVYRPLKEILTIFSLH